MIDADELSAVEFEFLQWDLDFFLKGELSLFEFIKHWIYYSAYEISWMPYVVPVDLC